MIEIIVVLSGLGRVEAVRDFEPRRARVLLEPHMGSNRAQACPRGPYFCHGNQSLQAFLSAALPFAQKTRALLATDTYVYLIHYYYILLNYIFINYNLFILFLFN